MRNQILLLFTFSLFSIFVHAQNNVGIGTTTPNAKAILELSANDKGLLVPRVTTTQRLAIIPTPEALLVYDTDLSCFFFWNATIWVNMCNSGATGTTGPQGNTGATGAQGIQGIQGTVGATGAQGIQGIQGNTGATGTQGITGYTGATGAQGIQGVTGSTGADGATGPQGNTGGTGSQGIPGIQGNVGATGAQGIQGVQGNTGATGTQGVQGITGNTGPTGAQGIQGVTGSTGNDGATGATGTQGIQGVTGSTGNSGATGATGAQGIQGVTGSTGADGATGATGAQGIQGVTGSTGADGATGAQGVTGSTGADGATGATGAQGIQGVTGSTGNDGATGATGAQGIQGVTGSTGADGATGATGAQGIQGVTGSTGADGATGAIGVQGVQGINGNTGPTGAQGIQGVTGSTGATGAQGIQGATGATGADGATGATGAQGIQGVTGSTGADGATGATGTQGLQGITGNTGANGATGSTGPTGPDTYCPGAIAGYIPVFTSATEICNSVVFQLGTSIGVNTLTPAVSFDINTTDGIKIPTGTTAQRPSGATPTGTIRYNTTLGATEVYTGTCWQNINTPPIGATYVQWFSAADPNAVYPCTQWVSTDIQNGEFLRARGGASNVAAAAPLTGTVQNGAVADHTHSATGTATGAGILTTSSDGAHTHNWGSNWSNDDSRAYDVATDNGDGNGNTISDASFWWGGGAATGNADSRFFRMSISGANPVNSGIYIPYDDNLSSNVKNLSMNDNPSQCGSGWDGRHTVGNFMGRLNDGCMNHTHTVDMYAHRHWIKARPTTSAGVHTHTIADHTHTLTIAVGNMSSGSATETRPTNVAVVYWRRVN